MWSFTKRKLESFLCDSLKGRVEYYCTKYRKSHDGLGKVCIIVDKKTVLSCSDTDFDYRVCDKSRYKRGEGGHYSDYKDRQFTWWTAENTQTREKIYSTETFFEAVGFLFDNPISKCINHFNDIVVCLALIDRRVGKRTLEKIKNEIYNKSKLVKYFYSLRYEAEFCTEVFASV